MRKTLPILLLLMPYPARAQVGSGTIVVFNFSKNQIVVAADSRMVRDQNINAPDDSYCKIAALSHQFIFTAVGHNNFASFVPTLLQSWDNIELARDAVQNTPDEGDEGVFINAIATYWANTVGARWNSLYRWDPLGTAQKAETSHGQLTAGIFIQANGLLLRGIAVSFNSANPSAPIQYVIATDVGNCWSCGQEQGARICAAGNYLDFVADFCKKRKKNTKVTVRTPLTKATPHVKLAVKIAELTVDAYEKTEGNVGGPVDAVTISNDGKIIWNARKPNCPNN